MVSNESSSSSDTLDAMDSASEIGVVPSNPPRHVAVIMDGNGRWGQRQGLGVESGHRAGARVVSSLLPEAIRCGTLWLTLFAFSTENWYRPPGEVGSLLRIIGQSMQDSAETLLRLNVRLRVIGDLSRFNTSVTKAIRQTVQQTRRHSQMELVIALGYGGRMDIIRAARTLAAQAARQRIAPGDITEQMFAGHLMTAGIPDPDLIIRTGGKQRMSNFMAWQSIYSELYFCDRLWPDFTPADYHKAICNYSGKERSFGTRINQDSA